MGSDNDYWDLVGVPRNRWIATECTWRDILAATEALNALEARGGETETFAPLHRIEGGFMCVSGPGFVSDEPADDGTWTTPGDPDGSYARKAIRFDIAESWLNWPSVNHTFEGARPDDVIFRGDEVVRLRFEGQLCKRWTKKRCTELMETVAKELKWEPLGRGYSEGLIRRARSRIQSDGM